jgi:hypothetical protein
MDQAFPLPLVKFCSSAFERITHTKSSFLVQVLQLTVTSNIVCFVSWVRQLVLYWLDKQVYFLHHFWFISYISYICSPNLHSVCASHAYCTKLNLITALFLGLSNGYAFAQEDSVSQAASSEQAEGNATGLQLIEDGSVVSNEHTVKWRIFTDNGREFFQKASNTLSLASLKINFRFVKFIREPSFHRFHIYS